MAFFIYNRSKLVIILAISCTTIIFDNTLINIQMKNKNIPEWIEKLNAYDYPSLKGEKHEAFNDGALSVLNNIGLEGVENPKEWVEKTLKAYTAIDITNALLKFIETTKDGETPFTSRIQMFDTEVDAVDIILWASKADVCDSPIKRVIELRQELTEAQLEIVKLKHELRKHNN